MALAKPGRRQGLTKVPGSGARCSCGVVFLHAAIHRRPQCRGSPEAQQPARGFPSCSKGLGLLRQAPGIPGVSVPQDSVKGAGRLLLGIARLTLPPPPQHQLPRERSTGLTSPGPGVLPAILFPAPARARHGRLLLPVGSPPCNL